jgi:hypothetical protein
MIEITTLLFKKKRENDHKSKCASRAAQDKEPRVTGRSRITSFLSYFLIRHSTPPYLRSHSLFMSRLFCIYRTLYIEHISSRTSSHAPKHQQVCCPISLLVLMVNFCAPLYSGNPHKVRQHYLNFILIRYPPHPQTYSYLRPKISTVGV